MTEDGKLLNLQNAAEQKARRNAVMEFLHAQGAGNLANAYDAMTPKEEVIDENPVLALVAWVVAWCKDEEAFGLDAAKENDLEVANLITAYTLHVGTYTAERGEGKYFVLTWIERKENDEQMRKGVIRTVDFCLERQGDEWVTMQKKAGQTPQQRLDELRNMPNFQYYVLHIRPVESPPPGDGERRAA